MTIDLAAVLAGGTIGIAVALWTWYKHWKENRGKGSHK